MNQRNPSVCSILYLGGRDLGGRDPKMPSDIYKLLVVRCLKILSILSYLQGRDLGGRDLGGRGVVQ
jgi:hypothetical protein